MKRTRQNQELCFRVDNVDVIDKFEFGSVAYRRGFTLLELLSVIGTLAILFALILPAVKLSTRTGLKRQAQADATALAQAVQQYRNTYGFWPGTDKESFDDDRQPDIWIACDDDTIPAWTGVTSIVGFLGINVAGGAVVGEVKHVDIINALLANGERDANPRNIVFLDIPVSRLSDDGHYLDPWGTPYAMVIHPLKNTDGSPSIGGRVVGQNEVVVFSFGPPGRVHDDVSPGIETTVANLIFSAGVPR